MHKIVIPLFFYLSMITGHAQIAGVYTAQNHQNIRWEHLPIKICPSKNFPNEYLQSLYEAAEIWNKNFEKALFNTRCRSKVTPKDLDQKNDHSIFWMTQNFDQYTDKTSLARTLYSWDESSNNILDADIVLNGEYYDWKKTKIDLTTVFAHELGHVLGLEHNFISPNSVMNYYPYVGGYQKRDLDPNDILLVKKLYFNNKDTLPNYFQKFFSNELELSKKDLVTRWQDLSANEFYALSIISQKIKDTKLAIHAMEEYLKKSPKDYIAIYKLGDLYWNQDNTAEAEKKFKEAILLSSDYYEPYVNLGVILLNKGLKKDAIANLKKTLEIQPTHYLACSVLFDLLKEKKYQKCFKRYSPK